MSTSNLTATTSPASARSAISHLLMSYWYYLGIIIMFFVGWLHPSFGLWMKSNGITPYLVAVAFFLNGCALSTKSILSSVKQWRVLCVALGITFIVSPLIVLAIRHLLPNGNTLLAQGFQLVSLVPTLFVSAVVLTRMAKGNAAMALYLTISSNLLAIVFAPILVKLTLGANAGNLHLASTTVSMVFTVLLPTILGQFARMRWETWAEHHAKFISVLSQCTILIFIITGVSSIPRAIISPSMVLTAILFGILLHVVLLITGRFGGILIKCDESSRRAVTFCSAQKSFVFNVLLCEQLFAGNSTAFGIAILPGIIYYLIELSVDSIIAQWWSQHRASMPRIRKETAPRTLPHHNRAIG